MNIGKLVSDNPRYSYYIEKNDFANLWVKMHADLGYPLKVDSRYKRAIIYNKQGLEKQIEDMIISVIGDNLQELADIVANDITNQLDSLTQNINGKLVKKSGIYKSNMGALIGKAIGKGIVKGFSDILDDITDVNNRK